MFVWRRIPRLQVRVTVDGGSVGAIDCRAWVSEVGNIVPAMQTVLSVWLEGTPDPVYVSSPFNLRAGEVDHVVGFTLARPTQGVLVRACNNQPTLYGRALTVEVSSGRHKARAEWRETAYDSETDGARHEAMEVLRELHTSGIHLDGPLTIEGLREARAKYLVSVDG
jgi:hypothetical protein